MLFFSAEHKLKDAPPTLWIFFLTSLYILSQAFDFFLFHFLVDIHLAVMAMVTMLLSLAVLVRRYAIECLQALKSPVVILTGWGLYLLVNAALGLNWLTSVVFLFRFIVANLIAIEIGTLLYHWGEKARYAIGIALLMTFLIISFTWYRRYVDPTFLNGLIPLLRDYKIHPVGAGPRAQGLYVNTNILGFVLVIHAALAIWYSLHRKWSMLILPAVWLLAAYGVMKTQSRNALFGIAWVGLFSTVIYSKRYLSSQKAMVKALLVVAWLILIVACLQPIADSIPRRWHKFLFQLFTFDWAMWDPSIIKQQLQSLDKARVDIWQAALDYWMRNPWTGVGLGCFYHIPLTKRFFHAHNFLLNTLVEQGLIGIGFLLAFLVVLVRHMQDWRGVGLLACFLSVQIFEDETTSAAMPIYLSLILGYCFWLILQNQRKSLEPLPLVLGENDSSKKGSFLLPEG